MKQFLLFLVIISTITVLTSLSCKKNHDAVPEEIEDTTGTLIQAAMYPVGIGINHDQFLSNPMYDTVIKQQFTNVTFEKEMKQAIIIGNDGTYDYTKADELMDKAQSMGLNVYGHAPIWYLGNNGTYLRSLTADVTYVNALQNAGFEGGSGDAFTNWYTQVSNDPPTNGSITAETSNVFEGHRAMKVDVITPGPYQYSIQAINDPFNVVTGSSYTLNIYAKAATSGSQFKLIVQNTTYMERIITLTDSWQKYSWTFTANEPSLSVKLQFPNAGTFWFDSLYLPKPLSGVNTVDPVRIDSAMKKYLTTTITRYKDRVHAWDVVNEPLSDGTGSLRIYHGGIESNETFYWADYLGRQYIAKAFQYAHAADPTALLFLNEDKLESDGVKLDSMVNLINELKAQGVPINGIGVEMHTTIKNDFSNIDRAFQKLAATGLKIRVSEMDIRVNPWNYSPYTPTDADLYTQRSMYKYVAKSYLANVPVAQRYGISVWDLTDADSWIVTGQHLIDYPTLFNPNFTKKSAFYGFLVGLKKR
jgi:endo-1,4-beta-xylanase